MLGANSIFTLVVLVVVGVVVVCDDRIRMCEYVSGGEASTRDLFFKAESETLSSGSVRVCLDFM